MKRDLKAMGQTSFDILILGGGISGSTIAWDAALRGLKVGLVEKNDFSHATSSATSKLIHGGLRYLANLEFGLIRESLKERRIWETIAPHMVDPLPFLVPNYGKKSAKLVMDAGFYLYDLLSFDRKWLKDESKRLPRHRRIPAKKVLELAPNLDPDGLLGGIIYYDCQMYSPERLGLACLLGAARAGAQIANYAESIEVLKEGGRVIGARVEDRLSGESVEIKAAMTINAGGPWADYILKEAESGVPSRHLIRSKGIHIITRSLTQDTAVFTTAGDSHVLFLPWRGHTIIGTTDTFFQDEPDLVATTQEDIDGLLEKAASVHPGAKLSRQDVQHFYVGLRPLVDTDNNPDNNTNTYTASRAAEIVDHEVESNLPGLLSAIGGKWTTSRNVASKVVDKVLEKLPHRLHQAKPCATAHTPIYAGDTGPFAEFSSRLKSKHPNWPEDILDNLAKNYGTKAETVLSIANDHSSPLDRLCEDKPEIAAEIVYTVRHEMALALDDVIFRRTGIGTLGHPGQDVLNRCAEIMAEELGWDEAEKTIQIERVLRRFEIGLPATASNLKRRSQ